MAKKLICSQCGTTDQGDRKAQGSLLGEIILWIIMIILGPYTLWISVIVALVYSLWRVISKMPICGSCKSEAMIDVKSPKGRRLIDEMTRQSK